MINFWFLSSCWLWIWVPIFSENPTHALFLSLTEAEVLEGKVNFNVKVFSDDLQDALKNHSPSEYKPADLNGFFSVNKEVAKHYFAEYFQLWVADKKIDLQLEGFDIEGDAHFISFSGSFPKNTKGLTIKASFFMELFPTQTNVVKVKKGAQLKYLRFDNPGAPQVLSF